MYDVDQAREFITALTGSDTSVVTFQVFFDPKDEGKGPAGLAEIWHSTLDASIQYIDYKQSQAAGVYICINGTDGKGREIYNINNLRVLFADFDGQAEPTWVLPPHLIQSRDATHGHAFWLIDAGDLSHDEWSILQKHIALFYGTDEQVTDPCRVARLPGTLHLKNRNSPQSYTIKTNNSKTIPKYSIQQIRDAHVLSADKDAVLNQWAEKRAGINTGVGYEDNPVETAKFISFIKNAAFPAVLGSGTHELFRVSCYGHDHGVSLDNAKTLLWEHYNPRCLPPWSEDERHHFEGVVYRAYHYSTSAAGCKTARAGFQALPPLPEPNCGWDAQRQQFNQKIELTGELIQFKDTSTQVIPASGEVYRSKYRLSKEKALILAPQLTVKSSHYDFASVFDGINYDGISLIRCKKQFYIFNGRSWGTIDDDAVKAYVQKSFAIYKPADAFTSGIYRVLCDLVNVEEVENGTWLSDRKTDTSNYTVFRNGIVDLNSEDLTIMPHTAELFSLNELDHDFDPNAACPRFLGFLTSIWDYDFQLKMQLQEFFGYCLTSDVSLQHFAVFMGKAGAGKGVLTDILSAMVGNKNTASPILSNLATNSALHEMATKSLTLIPDAHNVNNSVRDSVLSNLKAIIGGDPVSYHEMYKGPRSVRFKTKIVMSTNNMPEFNDPSGALVRRMLVFPFWKSFKDNPNTKLRDELMIEIAGITQWAIEGLRRLRDNNGRFTEAKVGLVEKEELRKDMFPLAQFVESSCLLDDKEFTLLDDLYNAYRLWAATQGMKNPLLKSTFDKSLRSSALPINHSNGEHKGFHGITVKAQFAVTNVIGFPPIGNV